LKQRCDELAIPRTEREAIMTELREGIMSPGRAFLLPFNYPQLDPVEQYFDDFRLVLVDPPAIEQEVDAFYRDIRDGEERMINQAEPHAARHDLFLEPDELSLLHQRKRIEISRLQVIQFDEERHYFHFNCLGNGQLRAQPDADHDGLEPLLKRLEETRKEKTLLVCHQQTQAERLQELLAAHRIDLDVDTAVRLSELTAGSPRLVLGELNRGFYLCDEKLNIISEEEIFGRRSHRRKKSGAQRARQLMTSLAELKNGDYIVHTDHGIGRYLGLTHLRTGALEGDFLNLEYAGNDKLYLPIERIEKVQKYVGGEGYVPKLDKMGGQGWEKARLKARAAVEELARQLLELYAKRELRQGFAYSPPDQLFREFEATFPHEETVDQLQAIDDVLTDMQSTKPMDRLVCGDVGYGKTEVALRAAVKAILDGKQVAVLVPTTVLANQHWESFRQRLDAFPIRVGMISRFRSAT
jgi:transcription-repair coupling factor (superfamily II helicase)